MWLERTGQHGWRTVLLAAVLVLGHHRLPHGLDLALCDDVRVMQHLQWQQEGHSLKWHNCQNASAAGSGYCRHHEGCSAAALDGLRAPVLILRPAFWSHCHEHMAVLLQAVPQSRSSCSACRRHCSRGFTCYCM